MPHIVSVDNVHKRFGDNAVLNGVSLQIDRGQVLAIIGRSGSGKSTLLRCLNGLEQIDSGSIRVCDTELHGLSGKALLALRQRVGIVFQSYNLFPHLTVRRNVTLALTSIKKLRTAEAGAIALKVLDQVGMAEKLDAYPEQLSGGQQQRVAIARALAMMPEIVLFDEVTSALDPELTGEVLRTMEGLARDGMTMALVTHEMSFARRVADVLVFMHDGKVWESGSPEVLFSRPRTNELDRFLNSELLTKERP
jgi:polar amino acid transport system ATP-binding protein